MALYYILKRKVRHQMLTKKETSGNLPEEEKNVKLKWKPPSLNCSFSGVVELSRLLFLHQHFLPFHQYLLQLADLDVSSMLLMNHFYCNVFCNRRWAIYYFPESLLLASNAKVCPFWPCWDTKERGQILAHWLHPPTIKSTTCFWCFSQINRTWFNFTQWWHYTLEPHPSKG